MVVVVLLDLCQLGVEGEQAGDDVAVRLQQFGPEQLTLALLISLAFPALGKALGSLRDLLLGLVHRDSLVRIGQRYI